MNNQLVEIIDVNITSDYVELTASAIEEALMAEVKRTPTYSRAKYDEVEAEALIRSVKDVFERYASFFPRMPKELLTNIMTQDSPIKLYEAVTFNCNLNYRDKQTLLEETNIINKLSVLFACLSSEVEILELENLINEQTKNSIDKGQKEYKHSQSRCRDREGHSVLYA